MNPDVHEPGRALPVVDTVPALAEGTAGVELAGKAERAITANPKALEPWAYDEAGRQAETPPQEHERELDALPPEGWHKPKALPQKRDREVDVPLQGGSDGDRRGRGHKALRLLSRGEMRACSGSLSCGVVLGEVRMGGGMLTTLLLKELCGVCW